MLLIRRFVHDTHTIFISLSFTPLSIACVRTATRPNLRANMWDMLCVQDMAGSGDEKISRKRNLFTRTTGKSRPRIRVRAKEWEFECMRATAHVNSRRRRDNDAPLNKASKCHLLLCRYVYGVASTSCVLYGEWNAWVCVCSREKLLTITPSFLCSIFFSSLFLTLLWHFVIRSSLLLLVLLLLSLTTESILYQTAMAPVSAEKIGILLEDTVCVHGYSEIMSAHYRQHALITLHIMHIVLYVNIHTLCMSSPYYTSRNEYNVRLS